MPSLRYADLQRAFADQPQPTLAAVADAVRAIRCSKGMLLVPGDSDVRSAGSFFRNPVVSAAHFAALSQQLGAPPPSYPAPQDQVKLPSAWLIEQAGFARGFRLGNVGISSRHTLALINCGGGTAAELLKLRDHINDAVFARFNIRLEMEPVLLGF
jgi:UDP-N-acetylmuramate dehydrogenase